MSSDISTATQASTTPRLSGMQVFAILLIPAVWLIDTTIMAPALGPIAVANPHASSFWINVVFSIPYITSIIFSAVSGRLSRRIDKKVLTVIGLVVYGVSGILPAFTGGLLTIFFLRLITGVGLGLALPMPNVYIADYYAGDKREKMLGYANVVAQTANIVVLVIAGSLINLGWRAAFYAYGLVLIIAIVNLIWLPKSRGVVTETGTFKAVDTAARERLQLSPIIGIGIAMTAFYVCFAFAAANISAFIVDFKLAGVGAIGIIATAPAIGNIIGSVASERLRRLAGSWIVFIAVAVMAIGFLIFSAAASVLAVVIATGLVGLSIGLMTPYLLNLTAQRVGLLQKGLALGVVSGCINFGVLLFPYVQQLIGVAGRNPDLRFLFTVVYIAAFAGAVVLLIVGILRRAAGGKRPTTASAEPAVGSGDRL